MDEKRKGEIALALLRYRTFQEGIRLTPDLKKDFDNVAKRTWISEDEMKCFLKILFEELLEEIFDE